MVGWVRRYISSLVGWMIFHWLTRGYVKGVHLGTPCYSFSRARDHPGVPPPLRSDGSPLGLPNLKPHDQRKVQVGNLLMYFSCWVLHLCLQLHIPGTLGNPRRSRLWICPSVLRWLKGRHSTIAEVTFCAFGMPWKKPTRFYGVHTNLDQLMLHYCPGAKRGCCLLTGKLHVTLCGQTNGVWRTKLAEPYPIKLGKLVAKAFNDVELSLLAVGFHRRLT